MVIDTLKCDQFNSPRQEHQELLNEATHVTRMVHDKFQSICVVALIAWALVPIFTGNIYKALPHDIYIPYMDPDQSKTIYWILYAFLFLGDSKQLKKNVF